MAGLLPDTDLSAALGLLVNGDFHRLPVVAHGRVVGLLDRAHVRRALHLGDELGLRAPSDGAAARCSAAAGLRG
jgi:CBS domain-containing protein